MSVRSPVATALMAAGLGASACGSTTLKASDNIASNSAMSDSSTLAVADPTSELAIEWAHVADMMSPWPWIYVGIVAAISWAAVHMIDVVLFAAMRRGWQLPRRRPYVGLVLQCLALGTGTLAALRPFFTRAPLLTATFAAAAAVLVAVVFRETLQSVVAALGMTTRGRLHLGDHVDVDGVSGTVRQFGLTHTRLRATDASTLWVPNRVLARRTVVVGGVKNASRIRSELSETATRLEDPVRVRLSRLAYLSPYRRARSPVSVSLSESSRPLVELQTWATRDVERVSLHLRRALEHSLQGATVSIHSPGEDPR